MVKKLFGICSVLSKYSFGRHTIVRRDEQEYKQKAIFGDGNTTVFVKHFL